MPFEPMDYIRNGDAVTETNFNKIVQIYNDTGKLINTPVDNSQSNNVGVPSIEINEDGTFVAKNLKGQTGQQGRGFYRSTSTLTTSSTTVARSSISPTTGKLLVSDTIVDKNGLVFAVTREANEGDSNVNISYRTSIKGAKGDKGDVGEIGSPGHIYSYITQLVAEEPSVGSIGNYLSDGFYSGNPYPEEFFLALYECIKSGKTYICTIETIEYKVVNGRNYVVGKIVDFVNISGISALTCKQQKTTIPSVNEQYNYSYNGTTDIFNRQPFIGDVFISIANNDNGQSAIITEEVVQVESWNDPPFNVQTNIVSVVETTGKTGLGNEAIMITNENIDDFRGEDYWGKTFYIPSGSKVTGLPPNTNGGVVEVLRGGGQATVHRYTATSDTSGESISPNMLQRQYVSSWTNWEEVVSADGSYPNLGAGKSEILTEPFTVGIDTTAATTGYVKFASVSLPAAHRSASARFEVLDKNPVNAQTNMCGVEVVVRNIGTESVTVTPQLLYGSSAYLSKIYACVKKGVYPIVVDLYFNITSDNPQDSIACIKPLFTFTRATGSTTFTFINDNELVSALPTNTTNTQLSTVYTPVTEAERANNDGAGNNIIDTYAQQNGDYPTLGAGSLATQSKVQATSLATVGWWKFAEISYTDATTNYSYSAILNVNGVASSEESTNVNRSESGTIEVDFYKATSSNPTLLSISILSGNLNPQQIIARLDTTNKIIRLYTYLELYQVVAFNLISEEQGLSSKPAKIYFDTVYAGKSAASDVVYATIRNNASELDNIPASNYLRKRLTTALSGIYKHESGTAIPDDVINPTMGFGDSQYQELWGVDWHEIDRSGHYVIRSNTEYPSANCPVDSDSTADNGIWHAIVLRYTDQWIVQIAIDVRSQSGSNNIQWCSKINNVWSDWTTLPHSVKGTYNDMTVGNAENLTEPFIIGKDTTSTFNGYIKFAEVEFTNTYQNASLRLEICDKNYTNVTTALTGLEVTLRCYSGYTNLSTSNCIVRLLYGNPYHLRRLYISLPKTGSSDTKIGLYYYVYGVGQEEVACIKPLFNWRRSTTGTTIKYITDNIAVSNLPSDKNNLLANDIYTKTTEAYNSERLGGKEASAFYSSTNLPYKNAKTVFNVDDFYSNAKLGAYTYCVASWGGNTYYVSGIITDVSNDLVYISGVVSTSTGAYDNGSTNIGINKTADTVHRAIICR